MPRPADMGHWLGQKYAILGKHAEGEYQRNIAEAGKSSAETQEIPANAASLRALQGAQGFGLTATGQLHLEQAGTENRLRDLFQNDATIDLLHDRLRQQQQQGGPLTMSPGTGAPGAGAPRRAPAPTPWLQLPSLTRPVPQSQPSTSLRPQSGLIDFGSNPQSYDPAADPANILYNRRSNMERGGGAASYGFRKGTANVKAPTGSKGTKASKNGSKPTGLEDLLAALSAGAGAAGSQAGPALPPPMAPGAAAPPGFARGGIVRGYQEGTENVPLPRPRPQEAPEPESFVGVRKGAADVKAPSGKGKSKDNGKSKGKSPSNDLPKGLAAILPALLAAQATQGAGPQVPPQGPGFVGGTPEVQPMSNYPFGAGYLFGANTVPGEGTGKVDTIPAMLAPHEAVLNRAAADMLGRGLIAALNASGVKRMGLGRGTT